MAVNLDTESEKTYDLKGTPANPAKEPRMQGGAAKTRGTVALNDALIFVGLCWAALFLIAFSLRSYNI